MRLTRGVILSGLKAVSARVIVAALTSAAGVVARDNVLWDTASSPIDDPGGVAAAQNNLAAQDPQFVESSVVPKPGSRRPMRNGSEFWIDPVKRSRTTFNGVA